MAYRYDYTIYINVGSNEIACDVVYKVTPGRPATGPSYSCGGTPQLRAELRGGTLAFGEHVPPAVVAPATSEA